MKVLHIANNLNIGGVTTFLKCLLPMVKNAGTEVQILSISSVEDSSISTFSAEGIKVKTLGMCNLYHPITIIKLAMIFKKIQQSNACDLIHVHQSPAQYWVTCASFLTGKRIPLITTEHSASNRRRGKALFKIADAICYAAYAKIISVSHSTEESLLKWQPQLQKRATVIFNGITLTSDSKVVERIPDDMLPGKKIKRIVMAARIAFPKDFYTPIKALCRLDETYHLFFLGDGDQLLLQNLKDYTQATSVSERVHFVGFKRVDPYLAHATVAVLSSRFEGANVFVLESLERQVPAFGSAVEGIKDVLPKEFLFKCGDADELAEKIKTLCENSEAYNKAKKQCVELVKHFDIRDTVQQYLDVYQSLFRTTKINL